MATEAQVTTLFHSQLNNDSRAQSIAAGAQWTSLKLSFFYSTEVSVDLGVKSTMLRILELEHATLPSQFWGSLSADINLDTVAGDAVTTIARVSSGAVRHNLPL
jgi:hypothetical protein